MSCSHHLELRDAARFDRRGRRVFYDERTSFVLLYANGLFSFLDANKSGATETVIYSSEHTAEIMAAALSPDYQWLLYQPERSRVFAVHLSSNARIAVECRQSKPVNPIIGVHWTEVNEFFFVTSHGIEYYEIQHHAVHFIKHAKCSVCFYKYAPRLRRLLCATSGAGFSFAQFQVAAKSIIKLPNVEIEVKKEMRNRTTLTEDDILIAAVYSKVFAIVLNTSERVVQMYMLERDSVTLAYSLMLGAIARWRFSVIDNLVVAHNFDGSVSAIFDTQYSERESIASPLPIAPYVPNLRAPGTPLLSSSGRGGRAGLTQYTAEWRLFEGGVVVDMQNGFVWKLVPCLREIFVTLGGAPSHLVPFLMRRRKSRATIIEYLGQLLEDKASLAVIGHLFDLLNHELHKHDKNMAHHAAAGSAEEAAQQRRRRDKQQQQQAQQSMLGRLAAEPHASAAAAASSSSGDEQPGLRAPNSGSLVGVSSREASPFPLSPTGARSGEPPEYRSPNGKTVVDQQSMFLHIFQKIEEDLSIDTRYMMAAITEYLRSLEENRVQVWYEIHTLIVRILVRERKHHQLLQFLQFRVINDLEVVAYTLLAVPAEHTYCFQLALDMLRRLENFDAIVEALLSRMMIGEALNTIRLHRLASIPLTNILELADKEMDDAAFASTFAQIRQLFASLHARSIDNDAQFARYIARYASFLSGPAAPASAASSPPPVAS